jgi:hypothetical protein
MQCKQRKAKCVRNTGEDSCERCISFGENCAFPQSQPTTSYVDDRFDRIQSAMNTMQQRIDRLEHELDAIHMPMPGSARAAFLATGADVRTGTNRRRQLPFVGRTRPAFSFDVARTSMREKGLSNDAPAAFSTAASPEPDLADTVPELLHQPDPLLNLSRQEVMDAIETFREEIHPVYPFVNMDEVHKHAECFFAATPQSLRVSYNAATNSLAAWDAQQALLLRVVVAVGKVIHSFGANRTSQQLVEFVETEVFGTRISTQATYLETVATALMVCRTSPDPVGGS